MRDDDTAWISIVLDGLAPNLVITAWLAYFFPPTPPSDPVFDIFRPIGVGSPPIAGVAVPLAPTHAGYTEGLGRDPNRFILRGLGPNVQGRLVAELDFNPLKPRQGPLRNELVLTDQQAAPAGSGAEQPACCIGPAPFQPIGASFLRVFDPLTGQQRREPDGRPELLRSPYRRW